MREEYDFSKGKKNPYAFKKQTTAGKDASPAENQKHQTDRPSTEIPKA